MEPRKPEASGALASVLRNLGDYEVVGLRLDRLRRQDCLDLCLVRKFERHVLRFWSPRGLEIHRDDDAPRLTVLIEDEPQGADGAGGVRVESPEGARSKIRFLARSVERFARWPTAWDMIIDEIAGLCLWAWRIPVGHFGVMNEEAGVPPGLAKRLDRWIKSKRNGRPAHELDAEGRELASLVLPYLGPSVILHLYLEAEERYERITAPDTGDET